MHARSSTRPRQGFGIISKPQTVDNALPGPQPQSWAHYDANRSREGKLAVTTFYVSYFLLPILIFFWIWHSLSVFLSVLVRVFYGFASIFVVRKYR